MLAIRAGAREVLGVIRRTTQCEQIWSALAPTADSVSRESVHQSNAKRRIGKETNQRAFFQVLRGSRSLGNFSGVSAVQAIDAGRPLRGWMLQHRGAVILQIQRQLHL